MMQKAWCFCFLILPLFFALPVAAVDQSPTTLQVGAAIHLGDDVKSAWESSNPKIVEVYNNGIAVALSPGEATVRGGRSIADHSITVIAGGSNLIDPAMLQQYPDNREFQTADGRKCVGSVLNGFMLGNGDQTFDNKKDHNRVEDPHPFYRADPYLWELQPHTPIVDGTGVVMGEVAPRVHTSHGQVPATKINYGMSKVIDGHFCVYAFSTTEIPFKESRALIKGSASAEGTSAWIPLDMVVKKEELLEKVGVGKGKLPAVPLEEQKYRITGGDPREYLLPDGHELSIVPHVEIGAVPSHYLRRPSGTVNITFCVPGFGLGGQSLDSLLVTSGAIFQRGKGIREFVMPTYYPKGDAKEGQKAEKTETFWYGAVTVPHTETIYGWVAKEALEPEQASSARN